MREKLVDNGSTKLVILSFKKCLIFDITLFKGSIVIHIIVPVYVVCTVWPRP